MYPKPNANDTRLFLKVIQGHIHLELDDVTKTTYHE